MIRKIIFLISIPMMICGSFLLGMSYQKDKSSDGDKVNDGIDTTVVSIGQVDSFMNSIDTVYIIEGKRPVDFKVIKK